MSVRFGMPVDGPRVVPFGQARKPSDVLPNGRPAFAVTSPFGPRSVRLPDGRVLTDNHDGLDLGNFHAGDAVLAMAPGRVSYTEAAQGIVRIDHGNGSSSGSAHMTGISVKVGQLVRAGDRLGSVGNVGTSTGAHLHYDITRNGVRLDPWPFLPQNQEADMLPTEAGYLARGTINAGVRLRVSHETTAGAELTDKAIIVHLLGVIRGGTAYTVDGRTDRDWYVVALSDGRVRQVAKLLLHSIGATGYLASIVPLPSADCSALETKITRAATALNGVVNANKAEANALKAAQEALR